MHLNGGCRYLPASDGRRATLQRALGADGVAPLRGGSALPPLRWTTPRGRPRSPAGRSGASCRRWKPARRPTSRPTSACACTARSACATCWCCIPSRPGTTASGALPSTPKGAEAKGGDDALLEYLEAVRELGYEYAMNASFRQISPLDEAWPEAAAALDESGDYTVTGPGRYLLKPDAAAPGPRTRRAARRALWRLGGVPHRPRRRAALGPSRP